MKISNNTLVSIVYDMYIDENNERKWKEQATEDDPLKFIFGAGLMIPGIENALKGLGMGDKFKFTLNPANAYGEYNKANVMALPKSAFEVNGEFKSDLVQLGKVIQMLDANNNKLNCNVLEIGEESVTVDFNHPLAGKTLHFSGEVIDVRVPTQEETVAYSPESYCDCASGCGGGGCGCSCDCNDGGAKAEGDCEGGCNGWHPEKGSRC
ncbi:MAG: peptidylprolyl isomerase [Tannerellaceae bacterium]|jgi:FKBP-type peptidyl-prolyl cis-trans isomerase SlyD|nr:peptidylprolyl isomerase [Tannerellaceae bacterium]